MTTEEQKYILPAGKTVIFIQNENLHLETILNIFSYEQENTTIQLKGLTLTGYKILPFYFGFETSYLGETEGYLYLAIDKGTDRDTYIIACSKQYSYDGINNGKISYIIIKPPDERIWDSADLFNVEFENLYDIELTEEQARWLRDNTNVLEEDFKKPEKPPELVYHTYKGTISGTGNADTRDNEITGGKLAVVRNFEIGYTDFQKVGGVIYDPQHDFGCEIDIIEKGKLKIQDGMGFAYGYFAYAPATEITILLPAVEQYHIIYFELNLSTVPQSCTVNIKNNQSSPNILQNTLRQDQLSTIKTGVFQIPLWVIKATNKGIEIYEDLREKTDTLKKYIQRVYHTDNAQNVNNNGSIGKNVTCPFRISANDSHIIVNTQYVDGAVKIEANR